VGDFDIQIDFDVLVGPSTDNWTFILRMLVNDATSSYAMIGREYNDNTNQYAALIKTNGSFGTKTKVGASGTDGKLRITKVGTTVTFYFWNGSDWTSVRSDTWDKDDLTIDLAYQSAENNPTFTGTFDNFTLNSGLVVWT
jgi:hypothetical protein